MQLGNLGLGLIMLVLGCQNLEQDVRGNEGKRAMNNFAEQASVHESAAPAPAELTHKVAAETPYYKDGPQQGRAPDGVFAKGIKVRIIAEIGSYAQVVSDTGIKAYVAVSDLESIPTP